MRAPKTSAVIACHCPSPCPLPASGEREERRGGRIGLLPACGEKVPEGRMRGIPLHRQDDGQAPVLPLAFHLPSSIRRH